jgi:hypothetical protein
MDNYLIVKDAMDNNGCGLLITFEEFEERRCGLSNKYYQHVRVDYIATCTHQMNVAVTNFLVRKTGLVCKECSKVNSIKLNRERGNIHTLKVENDGYNILEPLLKDKYDIHRSKEGCRCDIIIRKQGIEEDKWLNIQLKVNNKLSYGMYSFRSISEHYRDMLLICVNIEEQKIWIIPYNELTIKSNLNISIKSKYDKYLVHHDKIEEYINKYYDTCKQTTYEESMTPVSELQKREQEYIRKREKYIPFLKFEYLDIQNTPTDFIVNGFRVQEKVVGYVAKKDMLVVGFASNNGISNEGIRQFRTYRFGENQYYWLHSSIDNRFWIIPEGKLCDEEYISKSDETKNKCGLSFKSTGYSEGKKWLAKYEFTYENPDVERITEMFNNV